MKKMLLVFLWSFGLTALSSHEQAREIFMQDAAVQAEIAKQKQMPKTRVDTEAGSVFLSRSCGFAGCDEQYLVTVGVHYNPGANPSSRAIAAKVQTNTYFGNTVTIVDSKKIVTE